MKLQKLTSAWFTLEADPDKSSFEIKHLRSGEINQIVEKTYKQRFEFRKDEETDEMIPVPMLEVSKLEEKSLTIIEAVLNWKNVFDEEGVPLDCTTANKERFCKELSESDFVVFSSFIQDSRKTLADQIDKENKATEKN